ncbi:hypothetical protein LXL04_001818 [Taraxacum kok-saghyz]
MNLPMWNLRLSNKPFNPSIVYEGHPTLFTIKLYHGGEFTNFRDRKYIDGKVNYVDMVDIDEFSIHDLDAIMRGLRYGVPPYIYYHFLVPNGDFQFGFKMNPNPVRKVTLEQLDEDDEVATAPVLEHVNETPSKTDVLLVSIGLNAIVPVSPEYNTTRFWNKEKVLSSYSKRLIMEEFDIGLYQQILEGDSVEKDEPVNEVVIEEDEPVNEVVIEEDEPVNEEFVEQEQFEDQYVHVPEAQLDDFNLQDYMDFPNEGNVGTGGDDVELQGGDEVELQDGDNDQDSQTDDDDSEDSDYWVDEENLIPDIEVDMRDFHMSIDTDVEFMERPLNTNRGLDDNGNTEELDVIDNDAWDYVEEDSCLDRKRRAVLKDLGKENVWRSLTDMLLNNLCEVFNFKLIEGRDKPIISCLEYIREYMMKRICNVVKVQSKCVGPLTPTATKWLDSYCEMAKEYTTRWNGGNKYQVQGPWENQHVVDMDARECSCRKWELTGIPCKHVIAVLYDKADNGENVGELYTYVNRVHWLETWIAAYSFKIDPIKGRIIWPISDCPMKITHPKHHIQPGRPKRKRRKSMEERSQRKELHGVAGTQGSGTNLTRRFIRIRCGKCKHYGHNSRTCKGGVAGSQGGGRQGF